MLLIFAPACFFATLVTSSVNGGGGRSSAGSYTNEASLGGFGNIESTGSAMNKDGYIGQLTEVAGLSATGTPATVNETAATQLSGTAVMDDDTLTALSGNEINWAVPSWPLAGINASGVATAATVYANTSATVNGIYLGVAGSGSVLVLNTIPDNYGTYAGYGLPDWWQNQYFSLDNPNAAPGADVTGTGQNNLFKYVAGLDPTNAASVFRLRIEAIAGRPGLKKLIFTPRWNDRTYTPQFRTNLVSGASWTNLLTSTTSDNSTERTVIDTNAVGNTRFYRIQITYP